MTFEEWMNNEDKKRTCTYNVNLALVTSIEEAIFIRRLFYLWGKFKTENPNGIFIIGEDFWASTAIKDFSFRKVIKKWGEGGLLKVKKIGSPPTNYYTLNEQRIEQYLNEISKLGALIYNLHQEKRKGRKRYSQEEIDVLNMKINFWYAEIKDWYAEIKDWYAKIDFCFQGYIYNNIIKFFDTIDEKYKNISHSPSPSSLETDKKESTKKRRFMKNDIPYVLSEYQLSTIKEVYPSFQGKRFESRKSYKEELLQKWSREMDKLLRIDGREVDEVIKVIDFAAEDKFWFKNILSPAKLRKQYDVLLLKVKESTITSSLLDPDPTLTSELFSMFKIITGSPEDYETTPAQKNKFIQTTTRMIKFFEKGRGRIPRNAWVDYLKGCLIQEYKNQDRTIYPGTLCSNYTWNVLMPQYLQDLGCWWK